MDSALKYGDSAQLIISSEFQQACAQIHRCFQRESNFCHRLSLRLIGMQLTQKSSRSRPEFSSRVSNLGREIYESALWQKCHLNSAHAFSAIASAAVRPGDSIPTRFTNPGRS